MKGQRSCTLITAAYPVIAMPLEQLGYVAQKPRRNPFRNFFFRAVKIFVSRNVFLAVIVSTGCGFQGCDAL